MTLSDTHASSTTALPRVERKTMPRALRRKPNDERHARLDEVHRSCDVLEIFSEAARMGSARSSGRKTPTIADDPNGHRDRLGHGTFRRVYDDANELGIAGRVASSRTSQRDSTRCHGRTSRFPSPAAVGDDLALTTAK